MRKYSVLYCVILSRLMSAKRPSSQTWSIDRIQRSVDHCFIRTHEKWQKTLLTLKKISKVHFWTICQNIYFVQSIVIRVKLKNQSHLKMMNRFIFSKNFIIFDIAPKLCNLGSTNRPCTTWSDLARHLSIHTVRPVRYILRPCQWSDKVLVRGTLLWTGVIMPTVS